MSLFPPYFKKSVFTKVRKHYSKNYEAELQRTIAYLLNRNAGLKGENTKLKNEIG